MVVVSWCEWKPSRNASVFSFSLKRKLPARLARLTSGTSGTNGDGLKRQVPSSGEYWLPLAAQLAGASGLPMPEPWVASVFGTTPKAFLSVVGTKVRTAPLGVALESRTPGIHDCCA